MLRLNGEYATPHGQALAGTVWRWGNLVVDALAGSATVVVCCYPSAAVANAAGTPGQKVPIDYKSYAVSGATFGALALAAAAGETNSDVLNSMIYGWLLANADLFALAEDIGDGEEE